MGYACSIFAKQNKQNLHYEIGTVQGSKVPS
jgi:hypothetical protein